MSAQLKARIEMKQAFLKNLETERHRYFSLSQKYNPNDSNYGYYIARVSKCDILITAAKKDIQKLKVQLENPPLKTAFKQIARLSGIELRDNSR